MTTSGTATLTFEVRELIEEAFERAGTMMRSGYDLKSARRSLSIMTMEWANRGLNLWTVEEGTMPLVAGVNTYNLPADTIDLIEHWLSDGTGTAQNDFTLQRIGFSDYAMQVNKNVESKPTSLMVMRHTIPTLTVWPTPNQDYTLRYYRLRRIQDVGAYSNTMDMPFRFVPALIAGLAYYTAMKKPELAERVVPLKAEYDLQMQLASDEDRDRASLFIAPYIQDVGLGGS